MDNVTKRKGNNTGTRLMFGVLCFFGVATLILGVLQINRTINFSNGYNEELNSGNNLSDGLDSFETSMIQLQNIDTDGDGLSDFDELYVYQTSPYLVDSDSDGQDDKSEIENGFDPNCPKGQNCRQTAETEDTGTTGQVEEPIDYLPTEIAEQFEGLTAEQLRQIILESGGMAQEQLDAISDEALMAAYQETLEQ